MFPKETKGEMRTRDRGMSRLLKIYGEAAGSEFRPQTCFLGFVSNHYSIALACPMLSFRDYLMNHMINVTS